MAFASMAATHAVDPTELASLIERLDLSDGGFDVVVEAVGHPATIQIAMDVTRIGGMTALVGMAPTGCKVPFDPFMFTAQEKILAGSMYGSADPAVTAAEVMDQVAAGSIVLDQMLGPEYALDQIEEGIAMALRSSEGRVLILPGNAAPDDRR